MRACLILVIFAFFSSPVAAQNTEPKYEGKPLSYWVGRLQKAETDKDRDEPEIAISEIGSDAAPAVPALMEMLKDRSESYRGRVTRILREIGPGAKEAVPELVMRLKEKQILKAREGKEDVNAREIENLIRILGSIGPDAKEAVPVLITILTQPMERVRNAGIFALCNIGPEAKEAIPTIRRVLLDSIADQEKESEVFGQSFYTFSGLEEFPSWKDYKLHQLGPDVLPLLLELLDVSGEYGNRLAFREIAKLDRVAKKAAPKLIPFLRNDDHQLRFYSAVVLWRIEKNAAVVPVLAALLTEDDPNVAGAAAFSLGEIGPDAKEALPALKLALKYRIESPPKVTTSYPFTSTKPSPESRVRTAADEAIKKISPEPKK